MANLPTKITCAVSVMAILLFAYVVPTSVELHLVPRFGAMTTVLVVGDLFGCAGLALVDWKGSVMLLFALDVFEAFVGFYTPLPSHYMIYFADLIPSAVLALAVVQRIPAVVGDRGFGAMRKVTVPLTLLPFAYVAFAIDRISRRRDRRL